MSYDRRTLTICDRCNDFEWGTRKDWIVGMHNTDEGKVYVHLCLRCQDEVWYCSDCDDFHYLDQKCPKPGEEELGEDFFEQDDTQ